MHKKDRTSKFRVLPYPSVLKLVVTDDIPKSVKGNNPRISYKTCDCAGMTVWGDNDLWIYLCRDGLTHGVITHEIFHATHRAMQIAGDTFSEKHHEPYAHIAGYLADNIYSRLRKWGVRVK